LFALGLVISLWMISRVNVGADAACLLARGWLWAQKGIWVQLGNPAGGGGYVPGGLSAFLVGLPLRLWMDHRAPVLLILLSHIAAYLLLDRLVKETLGARARFVFAVVYWLNPWRLYQSAWLDNANYVFLVGAVHLWACYRQRRRPRMLHSFLMVTAVGLSAQLHLNALLPVFSAVLLWLRGYWKPHWTGVALGALVTIGSLIPFFLLALEHPEIIPINRDPVGLSLVRFFPVPKGISYWFRYASLFCSSQSMYAFDFTRSFGPAVSAALLRIFTVLGLGLGSLTVIFPFMANAWCWRRWRRTPRARVARGGCDRRTWLREYALSSFVACILVNALSPIPAMWWHNLIVLHAAVLPLLLWTDALLRTRRAAVVRRGLAAYLLLSVLLLLGLTVGSEQYLSPEDGTVAADAKVDLQIRQDLPRIGFNRRHWPRKGTFFYDTYLRQFELPPPAGD
jgi:hypothetical protein